MVDITIYIEGGVLPHENTDVQTLNNSQKLRESFHLLFSQITDTKNFNLIVEQGSGITQTVNFFKLDIISEDKILLIDLDASKEHRSEKIKDIGLENKKESVFFMVQEMEAWILSQPDKIDDSFSLKYKRERNGEKIKDDNLLIGMHPEDIYKPSKVLQTILKRYFSHVKRGKVKKKEYGKLKDAPELIALLDANELKRIFSDVAELGKKLNP